MFRVEPVAEIVLGTNLVGKADLDKLLELRQVLCVLVEDAQRWWGLFPLSGTGDITVQQRVKRMPIRNRRDRCSSLSTIAWHASRRLLAGSLADRVRRGRRFSTDGPPVSRSNSPHRPHRRRESLRSFPRRLA